MTQTAISRRVAVLIDGENFPATLADKLFSEIDNIGAANERRVYGDTNKPSFKGWLEIAPRLSLDVRHTVAAKPGKNAADIHLVIDAMDLLHIGQYTAFSLVSSDSDLTHLAMRLRRQGAKVFGFGQSQALNDFRAACDQFVVLSDVTKNQTNTTPKANEGKAPAKLLETISKLAKENGGWVSLGELGTALRNVDPAFTKGKLSNLLKKYPNEIEFIDANKPGGGKVRLRPQKVVQLMASR